MTDNNTEFDSGKGPVTFDTNTIVEVSGTLDRVTRNIDASEVEVLSKDHFFVAGLFTSIRPAGGQANQVDMYTRAELPALSGVALGQINTFSLTGSESYMIANEYPSATDNSVVRSGHACCGPARRPWRSAKHVERLDGADRASRRAREAGTAGILGSVEHDDAGWE